MKKQRRPRGTGCLYKHPKSRFWYIKYHRNGRPYQESTGTTDRRKAEKLLGRRVGEISTGLFIGPQAERIRYEELAQDLLNYYVTNGRKSLERSQGKVYVPGEPHLRKFFAGFRAVEITTSRIREFVRKRQEEGAANATINRSLSALKLMFNLAVKAEKLRSKPHIEMLTERNVRKGFVEDEEYEKLVRFYPELWWRAYLAVAYSFGWRKRNMLELRVRQVDLLNQTLCLDPGSTKNNRGQTVKMTVEVYELLLECVRGKRPEDFVFTRKDGKPIKDFRAKWRKACLELGLARMEPQENGQPKYVGLLVHDLRRSAVRNLERAGVPRTVAMEITGHKTEAVFRRYDIVNESDLADAARKLEQRQNSCRLVKPEPVEADTPTKAIPLTN